MRVLVAIDGSASARNALDLVRSLAWPDGTTIRVLQAGARPPLRRNGLLVDEPLVHGAGVADLIERDRIDRLIISATVGGAVYA
jgi:hypothetical protein